MKIAQKYVRNFLQSPKNGFGGRLDNQDPTFLTFQLFFRFYEPSALSQVKPSLLLAWDGINDDGSPNGDLESSIFYLERINELERSNALKEFRWLLREISTKQPWFIKSISGLADVWKYEYGQSFRAKDKVLTIECLESIDFRMTLLADLYRKSAYDMIYNRMLLPKSKRRFTVDILVYDYRKLLEEVPPTIAPLVTGVNPEIGGVSSASTLQWYDKSTSVIHFILEDCEFDFNENPLLETLDVGGSTDPSTQRFKIKVGRISERNQYTLMDIVLADKQYTSIIKSSGSGALLNDTNQIENVDEYLKPVIERWKDYSILLEDVEADKKNLQSSNVYGSGGGLLQTILNGDPFRSWDFYQNILDTNKENALRELNNIKKTLEPNQQNILNTAKRLGLDKVKNASVVNNVYNQIEKITTGRAGTELVQNVFVEGTGELSKQSNKLLNQANLTEEQSLGSVYDSQKKAIGNERLENEIKSLQAQNSIFQEDLLKEKRKEELLQQEITELKQKLSGLQRPDLNGGSPQSPTEDGVDSLGNVYSTDRKNSNDVNVTLGNVYSDDIRKSKPNVRSGTIPASNNSERNT